MRWTDRGVGMLETHDPGRCAEVIKRREVPLEPRIADRDGADPLDLDAVARGQPGDRAEHREPVIAARVEPAAAQPAGAADRESVLSASISAPSPQPLDHGRDPVRLLVAQLLGPVTTVLPSAKQPSRPPAAARRSPAAPPRRRPASRRSGPWRATIGPGGSPPPAAVLLDLDAGAHPIEDPQQPDPGGVQADPLEPTWLRDERRGHQGNAADEKSPGTSIRSRARRSAGRTTIRRPGRCVSNGDGPSR